MEAFSASWLVVCYVFLYAPIAFLIVFSLQCVPLSSSGRAFPHSDTGRYCCTDRQLIDAALLSLRIAAVSATIAVVIDYLAGFGLARFGRFRSRGAFEPA